MHFCQTPRLYLAKEPLRWHSPRGSNRCQPFLMPCWGTDSPPRPVATPTSRCWLRPLRQDQIDWGDPQRSSWHCHTVASQHEGCELDSGPLSAHMGSAQVLKASYHIDHRSIVNSELFNSVKRLCVCVCPVWPCIDLCHPGLGPGQLGAAPAEPAAQSAGGSGTEAPGNPRITHPSLFCVCVQFGFV